MYRGPCIGDSIHTRPSRHDSRYWSYLPYHARYNGMPAVWRGCSHVGLVNVLSLDYTSAGIVALTLPRMYLSIGLKSSQ